MKKLFFLAAMLFGLMLAANTNVNAQGNNGFPGPQFANRSMAALNQCSQSFRASSFWNVKAVLSSVGACAAGPAITGVRYTYTVIAEPNCDPVTQICPAVASVLIGEVIWCANEIESVTCYIQQ